jgi:hypothetical protein
VTVARNNTKRNDERDQASSAQRKNERKRDQANNTKRNNERERGARTALRVSRLIILKDIATK